METTCGLRERRRGGASRAVPEGLAQAGKAVRAAGSFELRADLLRAALVIRTGACKLGIATRGPGGDVSIEERFNPAIGRVASISGAMDPSIK